MMPFFKRLTFPVQSARKNPFTFVVTPAIAVMMIPLMAHADGLPEALLPVDDPVGQEKPELMTASDFVVEDVGLTDLLQTDIVETNNNLTVMPLTVAAGTTRVLKLKRDADSVAVGDPEIADIVVHDPRLLFVNGKAFGTTNLLIFDSSGRTLYSNDLVVTVNTGNLLTVNRAGVEQAYNCTPKCQVRASYENEGDN